MNNSEIYSKIYPHMIACFVLSYVGFFVGSFGNLWYFIIIIKSVRLRLKVTYKILLTIIVSDWLLNTIIFSMKIFMNYSMIIKNIPLQNPVFCLWVGSIYAVMFASSNLAQMYLTFYRSLAIFFPLYYRKISSYHSKKIFVGCLMSSYGITILISYGGIGWFVEYLSDDYWGECNDQGTNLVYRIIRRLFFIYVPIFGSLAIYFVIAMKIFLYQYKNKNKNFRTVTQSHLHSTISLFVRMLFCSVTVAPFWFDTSTSRVESPVEVTLWVKFLFQFSYSVNPIFYTIFDQYLQIENKETIKNFKRIIYSSKIGQLNR